jgi:hypothetical protein
MRDAAAAGGTVPEDPLHPAIPKISAATAVARYHIIFTNPTLSLHRQSHLVDAATFDAFKVMCRALVALTGCIEPPQCMHPR